MKRFLFVGVFIMCASPLYAACESGMYLNGDSDTCTICPYGHYCPGDDEKYLCPDPTSKFRKTFPDHYYNPSRWSSQYDEGRRGIARLSMCHALMLMTSVRGMIYEYVYYNPDTDQYDVTSDYGWAMSYPGYYLSGPAACGTYAYYYDAKVCPAGFYCPGKDWVLCDSSNKDTVHTETFGLYKCPDNAYSDAGASACICNACTKGTGVASCTTSTWDSDTNTCNRYTATCVTGYGSPTCDSNGNCSCTKINCSMGHFLNGSECQQCEMDTFSAGGSSTECTSCPAGTVTRTAGASSVNDCVALCGSGKQRLHAGNFTFNMYQKKHTDKSIVVNINGAECYVPLEIGKGNLNVSIGNTVYHAIR